jgi:hypothetical protein
MPDDAKSYEEGFRAGWLAGAQAAMQAMATGRAAASPSLEMAGSLPEGARRRGRPPKSLSMATPVKRRRGRPRKAETTERAK